MLLHTGKQPLGAQQQKRGTFPKRTRAPTCSLSPSHPRQGWWSRQGAVPRGHQQGSRAQTEQTVSSGSSSTSLCACGTGTMGDQVPSLVFEGPVESSTKAGWGMGWQCGAAAATHNLPEPDSALGRGPRCCPLCGAGRCVCVDQTSPRETLQNHDSSCRKPVCAYSHPSLTIKRKFKFPIQLQDLETQIPHLTAGAQPSVGSDLAVPRGSFLL